MTSWQHESSLHQRRPVSAIEVLLLTVDDHSDLNLAGRFVTADTTWNHFRNFREASDKHGIPQAIYTDGLSLFGPGSRDDRNDPRSQFQHALRALGIAPLVAPTPEAKGKVDRRCGPFQRRLAPLMAHAKAGMPDHADQFLPIAISRCDPNAKFWMLEVPPKTVSSTLLKSLTLEFPVYF